MMMWIVVGTVLQVAMVLAGHWMPGLRDFWGPGGMLISLIVGCLAASSGGRTWSGVIKAGALAGGVGALIGIVIAFALQDVPPLLILLGTLSSTVAGIFGAAIVAAFTRQTTKPV